MIIYAKMGSDEIQIHLYSSMAFLASKLLLKYLY